MELFEQFFKQKEIKFKAWDRKRKTMIPCATVDMEWHKMRTKEKDRYILVQYTGLKDKNGKEIYEGDILQGWNNKKYGGNGTFPTGYSVVEFKNGCFQVFGRPIWDALNDSLTPNSVEVIGNIFENPELLNPDNF